MNILIVDDCKKTLEVCNTLSSLEKDWNLYFSVNYDEIISYYKTNIIDIVIIDFSIEIGEKTLKTITTLNAMQRIITISDKLTYSESHGCETCISNLNKIRLLKPLEASSLYTTIINFDTSICQYIDVFKNIKIILNDIVRRYHYHEYDNTQSQIIPRKNVSQTLCESELVEIIDCLEQNNVQYTVKENSIVQLD